MNKHDIKRVLHDHAARNIARVDLWPAIERQLPPKLESRLRQRMRVRRVSIRLAAVGLAVLLCLGAIALSPAVAGTLFDQTIQRFGLVVLVSEAPDEPVQSSPSGVSQVPVGPKLAPKSNLSLAEAQQQTPFPILQPAYLPDNVELTKVWVGGSNSTFELPPSIQVSLTYRPTIAVPGKERANVMLNIIQGTEDRGGYEVSASEVRETTVNGHPAVYADRQGDSGMLSWQADGFTYVLHAYNLGLQQDDFVRIAESLE
ncbi:MAG: DUF4367 domain-containing protein [Chloroflexales bacterium]|nr:DUF4367 domain-containing protein [Chloroflexales bacterium]